MLVFFHVPHTGGRNVGRCLWHLNTPHRRVHQARDFQALEKGSHTNYFILRDPIQRAHKEFVHYSRRLIEAGRVNHLTLDDFSGLDPQNPEHYFGLEVNRNVYCKFLLSAREPRDFSRPITREDLKWLKENVPKRFRFDHFTQLPHLPVLEKILGHPVKLPVTTPVTFGDGGNPAEISEKTQPLLEKANEFDIELVKFLQQ
uniref:Uncharacterized protein n=1 Tax=viral metagenome TaxID=1070528 RepID=A0A6C0BMG0_9ZZZZ